jgi:hypothetical protein
MMAVAATVVLKFEIRGLTFFLQLTDYKIYKPKASCNDIMKTMKNVRVFFLRLIFLLQG